MNQQDTKFTPNQDRVAKCDECGCPAGKMIPVQWATGSTGFVGIECCGKKFDDEATVSEDGMAIAHWKK